MLDIVYVACRPTQVPLDAFDSKVVVNSSAMRSISHFYEVRCFALLALAHVCGNLRSQREEHFFNLAQTR